MKSFMKKVIMGALALAIVVSSIVSRPEVVKAGIKADGTGWDDDIWVFKIIPTDEILILTRTDVSGHWPVINEYNAKLLYDTYGYNEPAELFIGEYAYAFSDDDPRVKTVKIETECVDREGFRNPAGVLKIGGYAFNACHALTEIKCQSNVKIKTIDQCAFEFCKELKTIDLTEVETIGYAAFYECEYLEKIKFNEIESIGDSAFYNCRSLQEVDFGDWEAGTCSIAANAFAGVGVDGGANNPVLKLPANWPEGDLPTSVGSKVPWHGGYFDYTSIESISLNKSSTTLVVGENESLVATVEDVLNKATNKEVTWTSSDESVATVDDTGKVTAVAEGSTTITATSVVDSRKKDTCTVTVLPKYGITVESGEHGSATASKTEAPEGMNVTLTATPDEGYQFDRWVVVSGGVTVNDNKFTMPANDVKVKAVFKQVESPEDPSEEPENPAVNQEISINENGDLSRVVEVINSITEHSSSEETPVITLKMENGVTKVTKEVFEALKESDEDIKIVLDMGNCKWTIDSADITGTPTDIDFSVKIGDEAQTIEVDVINEVTGKKEKKSINITLAHSGDFKCKPTLTINVDEENRGYYANLFYYNPSSKKLEYVCAGRIRSNGEVDLKFSHASDYAIIISDKDMDPENSGKNDSKNSDKKKENKEPNIDLDTNKSEVKYGTVFIHNKDNVKNFIDMKVFTPDARTKQNQQLLAMMYAQNAGKKARILETKSIHPRNTLLSTEVGAKKFLTWVNLEKKAQTVYAVCYNNVNKAYYLTGTLNANGVAVFPDFIANEATNITIFTLE